MTTDLAVLKKDSVHYTAQTPLQDIALRISRLVYRDKMIMCRALFELGDHVLCENPVEIADLFVAWCDSELGRPEQPDHTGGT